MIIAVTDRKISTRHDFLEQIENVADALPDMIILREKDLSEPNYRYLAVECARLCGNRGIRFCVNKFVKTAHALELDDIQISMDDLRQNADLPFENIWVSVHSKDEAMEAERLGATHLIYGNVFETSCKPSLGGKGLLDLRDVCDSVDIPVFGIGGIDASNVDLVLDAGCKGVCMRSALMTSKKPSLVLKDAREKM